MMINDKEIQFPFDLDKILSGLMCEQSKEIIHPKQVHFQHPHIKRVIVCHDLDARKAIFGMDKRVTQLEEEMDKIIQLLKSLQPKKKPIKKTVAPKKEEKTISVKRVIKKKPINIPKIKSTSNTKQKSKK